MVYSSCEGVSFERTSTAKLQEDVSDLYIGNNLSRNSRYYGFCEATIPGNRKDPKKVLRLSAWDELDVNPRDSQHRR